MTRINALLLAVMAAIAADVPRLAAQQPAAVESETAQAIVDRAAREGLPTTLLRAKIAEGIAKHASAARIAEVARAYYDALSAVHGLSLTDATEWEAAASALRGGVSLAALRDIHAARPGAEDATAFIVALDLVQRGVPADSVRRGLVRAVKAGATSRDLLALQTHVAAAMVNGTSALDAYRAWRMPAGGAP